MCGKCEAALPNGAKFCSLCGARQPSEEAQPTKTAVREFVTGTAGEVKSTAIDLLKNKDVQKIAAGAALGAAIAPVIPFLSIPVGATLGGGYVLFKRLTR
jgi:predicted amidophosphoribosyltransferase